MKTLFATLTAVAAVTVIAAPAAAQARDHNGGRSQSHRYEQRHDTYRGGYNINQRQDALNRRIAISVRNGSLTRNEARRLVNESRTIARLEARYRNNGFSRSERADLDRRFDRLEAQIRHERRDRDYGYGYHR